MKKKYMFVPFILWGIGLLLSAVSYFAFHHENLAMWNISTRYNGFTILLSLVLLPIITMIMSMRVIRSVTSNRLTQGNPQTQKQSFSQDGLQFLLLIAGFLVYAVIFMRIGGKP